MRTTMIRHCLVALLLLCGLATAHALDAGDDIAAHRRCSNCGMDRKSYGYSRALLRFADQGEVGTCSLNCAVVEMDRRKEHPAPELLVADRDTLKLVEAKSAWWVMGGKKRGVMTERPKWAFAEKEAAEAFVKKYGSTLTDWDTVLKAAQDDAAHAHR